MKKTKKKEEECKRISQYNKEVDIELLNYKGIVLYGASASHFFKKVRIS